MTRRMSCSMTIPAGSWVAGIGALTPSTNHQAIGKPIRWEKSTTGKAIPLDPTPVADGNVYMHDGRAHVLGAGDELIPPEGDRFVSHFATCTHASEHRKARR